MAAATNIEPVVFLDASYAIAIASAGDKWRGRAIEIGRSVLRRRAQIVTTTAVLAEIGNALSKGRFRSGAIALLRSLHDDHSVTIVPLDRELYDRAAALYESRPDKEWGMTDCASFVVMQDRGITQALTADDHFTQAGFNALLK